ncbi:MAG: VIT family protein [Nocardiaceae bacterium]|nr:VIT family protein [Nocardiaceae bacterium]
MHEGEAHAGVSNSKLNGLRAAVLGANDGIVSIAGLVVGVAGATTATGPILTASIAGLLAGAISMAAGEYISVSTQRDTEKALLAKERRELAEDPDAELEELARIYEGKGLKAETAWTVARELTEHDAFQAHAEAELRIDPDDLTNPWQAAIASFFAFTVGALLPIVAILLPPVSLRVPVTFGAVVVALAITGTLSAKLGGANAVRATTRVVLGGAIAMIVTFVTGQFVGGFAGA